MAIDTAGGALITWRASNSMSVRDVLADLRVVELSRTAAAAFAGRLCADAGAEVVLVEPPEGHPLRHEGRFLRDERNIETSAAHLHINAGKRSVALNVEVHAETLLGLLDGADVFLTDFRAHEIDPLGLSWRALHERRPSLLMTRVTPFGDTGPYRRYEATNLICLALGGQLKITGDPDKPPLSNYGAQAEYQAGLSAFAATVANVLLRDATGEGEYLDLSALDVVATNLEHRPPALNLGLVANRAGLSVSATYGVYPCADGWVYITAFAPALWEHLKAIVQLPELEDARFATQASRLERNDKLQALLTSWTMSRTSADLREWALQGYPLTVAETLERLLASEQWRDRRAVDDVAHEKAGSVSVLRPPWLDAEPDAMRAAPRLGEANDELLRPAAEASR